MVTVAGFESVLSKANVGLKFKQLLVHECYLPAEKPVQEKYTPQVSGRF